MSFLFIFPIKNEDRPGAPQSRSREHPSRTIPGRVTSTRRSVSESQDRFLPSGKQSGGKKTGTHRAFFVSLFRTGYQSQLDSQQHRPTLLGRHSCVPQPNLDWRRKLPQLLASFFLPDLKLSHDTAQLCRKRKLDAQLTALLPAQLKAIQPAELCSNG